MDEELGVDRAIASDSETVDADWFDTRVTRHTFSPSNPTSLQTDPVVEWDITPKRVGEDNTSMKKEMGTVLTRESRAPTLSSSPTVVTRPL